MIGGERQTKKDCNESDSSRLSDVFQCVRLESKPSYWLANDSDINQASSCKLLAI